MSYEPDTDYLGADSFEYTVNDDSGTTSNVATVTLDVSPNPYPWHNTRLRYDVNDDGLVTAIDPLLIINFINSNGAGPLRRDRCPRCDRVLEVESVPVELDARRWLQVEGPCPRSGCEPR